MRLSTREYIFLTIGGFVLLAVVASEMIVAPNWNRYSFLKKKIWQSENDLGKMKVLLRRFQKNKILLENIEKRLVREDEDFSLFSFLERAAGHAEIRDRLASMSPTQKDNLGLYRRYEMSIRFDELTMKELVRFLEYLERAPKLIRVDRLRVDRSTRKPGYVKVFAKIITFAIRKVQG